LRTSTARGCLVVDGGVVDIEAASGGRFDSAPERIFDRWAEFAAWAGGAELPAGAPLADPRILGAPSPSPRQVFAVGLNYSEHAAESGFARPAEHPPVFTKFSRVDHRPGVGGSVAARRTH